MANTTGEKELLRAWPHESGLTAGTTKQEGRKPQLKAQEGTKVLRRNRALI